MKFVLETGSRILIHAYDIGSVSISGIHPDNQDINFELVSEWDPENQIGIFRKSIILGANGLIQDWTPRSHAELNPEHLLGFTELNPEIVLLGMGNKLIFPEQSCLSVLQQNNLGYEVMDTASACRTFNVLAAEGRDVVMGLLMLE